MEDYKIKIGIRNKVPYLISGPPSIVTDNSDYTLELVPDAEWDDLPMKTVYYVTAMGKSVEHPISGNTDNIPVILEPGILYIGVSAGELHTSRDLAVKVSPSVRRRAKDQIPDPEPNQYDKIMGLINQLPDALAAAERSAEAASESAAYAAESIEQAGKAGIWAARAENAADESAAHAESAAIAAERAEQVRDDVEEALTLSDRVNQLAETVEELEKNGASDEQIQSAVEEWLEENPIGGGVDFEPGNALELKDGVLNVRTTGDAEQDNTLPITSAGVHTIVGNIGAILDTI